MLPSRKTGVIWWDGRESTHGSLARIQTANPFFKTPSCYEGQISMRAVGAHRTGRSQAGLGGSIPLALAATARKEGGHAPPG